MLRSVPEFVMVAAVEAAGSTREIYKPHKKACIYSTTSGWLIMPPAHKAPVGSTLITTVQAKPVVTKEDWE